MPPPTQILELEYELPLKKAMGAAKAQLSPQKATKMNMMQGKRMSTTTASRMRMPKAVNGTAGKRRRGDFDFKGKARGEVSGARITVWYEEEHGGRKMDVPYIGVVNSCDPREGLYVKFEGFPEEMLITNEDDWSWGAHSRKPARK